MRTIEYLKLETSELYNVSGTQGLNLYRTFQYLLLHHLYVSYLYICIYKNLPILKKKLLTLILCRLHVTSMSLR